MEVLLRRKHLLLVVVVVAVVAVTSTAAPWPRLLVEAIVLLACGTMEDVSYGRVSSAVLSEGRASPNAIVARVLAAAREFARPKDPVRHGEPPSRLLPIIFDL